MQHWVGFSATGCKQIHFFLWLSERTLFLLPTVWVLVGGHSSLTGNTRVTAHRLHCPDSSGGQSTLIFQARLVFCTIEMLLRNRFCIPNRHHDGREKASLWLADLLDWITEWVGKIKVKKKGQENPDHMHGILQRGWPAAISSCHKQQSVKRGSKLSCRGNHGYNVLAYSCRCRVYVSLSGQIGMKQVFVRFCLLRLCDTNTQQVAWVSVFASRYLRTRKPPWDDRALTLPSHTWMKGSNLESLALLVPQISHESTLWSQI